MASLAFERLEIGSILDAAINDTNGHPDGQCQKLSDSCVLDETPMKIKVSSKLVAQFLEDLMQSGLVPADTALPAGWTKATTSTILKLLQTDRNIWAIFRIKDNFVVLELPYTTWPQSMDSTKGECCFVTLNRSSLPLDAYRPNFKAITAQ